MQIYLPHMPTSLTAFLASLLQLTFCAVNESARIELCRLVKRLIIA